MTVSDKKNSDWNNNRRKFPGYRIGCVIMASGMSKRFGENKLLAEFKEKSLIQSVLDLTKGDLFTERVVLTRTKEVEEICKSQDVSVIYHELPKRRDAIRVGVEALETMDAILFCPCDQPLLCEKSLLRMIEQFQQSGREDTIFRLSYEEKVGTPVLFGKGNFEELQNLPDNCGGAWVIKKYPERVTCIQAMSKWELFDIDTKEDLEFLEGLETFRTGH